MANKSKFEFAIVENVRKIRKRNGKTQPYIAMILNVTDGYIGQVESINSASMYSHDQLNQLATEFQCSPKEFMPEYSILEDK